jgi:hypothetical protein
MCGIIYVSLSIKAIQSNTQNLCISSPFMLEYIVPLSGNTSAGVNMVLQGVDPGFRNLPHRINLKLYYVSGQAIVRICFLLRIARCYLVSIRQVTML